MGKNHASQYANFGSLQLIPYYTTFNYYFNDAKVLIIRELHKCKRLNINEIERSLLDLKKDIFQVQWFIQPKIFFYIHFNSSSYKSKILQFRELQDFSLSFIRLLWTWRESNPRPNKEAICFLHAYLCLRFSCISKTRATHLYLSS